MAGNSRFQEFRSNLMNFDLITWSGKSQEYSFIGKWHWSWLESTFSIKTIYTPARWLAVVNGKCRQKRKLKSTIQPANLPRKRWKMMKFPIKTKKKLQRRVIPKNEVEIKRKRTNRWKINRPPIITPKTFRASQPTRMEKNGILRSQRGTLMVSERGSR